MTQIEISPNQTRVAFVGIGEIGGPVAGHLSDDGFAVAVCNRTPAKASEWLASHANGEVFRSPAAASDGATVIVTCVGNDSDLEAVFFGTDGVLSTAKPGSLIIDHTTASDAVARRIAKAATEAGIGFVDAPVSGGSVGAQNRALSIMCGGTDADFSRARSLMTVYARTVTHLGPAGAGQVCKMVNQICIAGVLEGLAEGIALAKASGLDPTKVLDAIRGGAAGSWQMENRASYMVNEDYPAGFAARLMHKDLGLAAQAGSRSDLSQPVLDVVLARYSTLLDQGRGGEDFTNLFRLTSTP